MKKEPFIYAATFLMDGVIGVIGLCVPLLAVRLGAAYDLLGLLGALSSFTYALGCLAYGRLSHRVGYRRSMSFAGLAVAVSLALYPFVTGVSTLIGLYALTWLLLSGFWPALQAWMGEGKDRRTLLRTLGRFNIAWALGILFGPAAGGILFSGDLALPFFICAALIGALALCLFLLKFRRPSVTGAGPSPGDFPAAPHFLRIAWVANFATFFATGTVRSLFPKLATDLGIAPEPLGWLMAAIGLAQVVAFYGIARTERWQFRLGPLAAAQFIGVAGLLTLAAGKTYGIFFVALLAQGTLTAMTFTASIFYSLFASGPGSQRTGLHEAILGGGFLLGPLAGGFAADHLGPRSPYLLCAGVILLAIGVETAIRRKAVGREPTALRPPSAASNP